MAAICRKISILAISELAGAEQGLICRPTSFRDCRQYQEGVAMAKNGLQRDDDFAKLMPPASLSRRGALWGGDNL